MPPSETKYSQVGSGLSRKLHDAIYDLGGGPDGLPVKVVDVLGLFFVKIQESPGSMTYLWQVTKGYRRRVDSSTYVFGDEIAHRRLSNVYAKERMRAALSYSVTDDNVQIVSGKEMMVLRIVGTPGGRTTERYTEEVRALHTAGVRGNAAMRSRHAATSRLSRDPDVTAHELLGLLYTYVAKMWKGGTAHRHIMPISGTALREKRVLKDVMDGAPVSVERLTEMEVDEIKYLLDVIGQRSQA